MSSEKEAEVTGDKDDDNATPATDVQATEAPQTETQTTETE